MQSLKFLLSWVGGVTFAVLTVSWWRNESVNWIHLASMILAGIIGVLIVAGIRKVSK